VSVNLIIAAGLFDSPWTIAIFLLAGAIINWLSKRRADNAAGNQTPEDAPETNPSPHGKLGRTIAADAGGEEPAAARAPGYATHSSPAHHPARAIAASRSPAGLGAGGTSCSTSTAPPPSSDRFRGGIRIQRTRGAPLRIIRCGARCPSQARAAPASAIQYKATDPGITPSSADRAASLCGVAGVRAAQRFGTLTRGAEIPSAKTYGTHHHAADSRGRSHVP
jgi:hypothetical protein